MTDKLQGFKEAMARQTTGALLDIVNSEEGVYDVLALEAAKNELLARNFPDEHIKITEAEIAEATRELENRRSAPLDLRSKIICILLTGTVSLDMADGLRADGYEAKAKACMKWTLWGFAFYILLVIIISIF